MSERLNTFDGRNFLTSVISEIVSWVLKIQSATCGTFKKRLNVFSGSHCQ